jgi:hypothetical protein
MGAPYLVHDPMERDQAEAVGCDHAPFEQHGMTRIQRRGGRAGAHLRPA